MFVPPLARKANWSVTVSAGSMMPLGGAMLSEVRTDPAGTTRLPLVSWIVRVAALGGDRMAFTGLNNCSSTVSSGCTLVLPITGTLNVSLTMPLVKLKMPLVGV